MYITNVVLLVLIIWTSSGIQFESVNEVNKIKFVMQPKSDFQFDFFIRIPHDFPYGYLKCSMPRDAETMNLDYLDILEVQSFPLLYLEIMY